MCKLTQSLLNILSKLVVFALLVNVGINIGYLSTQWEDSQGSVCLITVFQIIASVCVSFTILCFRKWLVPITGAIIFSLGLIAALIFWAVVPDVNPLFPKMVISTDAAVFVFLVVCIILLSRLGVKKNQITPVSVVRAVTALSSSASVSTSESVTAAASVDTKYQSVDDSDIV